MGGRVPRRLVRRPGRFVTGPYDPCAERGRVREGNCYQHHAVAGHRRRGHAVAEMRMSVMRASLLLLLALSPCAPSESPGLFGFRSSSSTKALEQPAGPSATTLTSNIAAPMAGISRSCAPSRSGLTSECRAYYY